MRILNISPILIFTFFIFFFVACQPTSQNINEKGKDILESHEVIGVPVNTAFQDTVYVPIYSDIYSESKDSRFMLTATLSIRNTSMTDSMYLQEIDYYDTKGTLVKKYIDKTLFLKPLESIDYVIEEDDKRGGTGANFILIWGANKSNLKPIFEAVMISTRGQQGISFITKGVPIRAKE